MAAEWLRGRVVLMHTMKARSTKRRKIIVWEWQVVNTVTGKIVHRDNSGCSLSQACDFARRNTQLARDVWVMGIKYRDTLPREAA